MRNIYLTIVSLFILSLFSTSCSTCGGECEFAVWDFNSMNILVTVSDAEGNDLIDPETEGNILESGVKFIYQNDEYELELTDGQPGTRAYLPHWDGLQVVRSENNAYYMLSFGEFGPDGKGYRNEKIVIDWGDGTKDEIRFDFYVKWMNCNDPKVIKKTYFRGEPVPGHLIEIIR